MKYVEITGHNMAYVEEGLGSPILLLHGYPENHSAWHFQLEELSKRYRVIAPDLLGWGESARPTEASFRYETELARLYEFIDKVVGEKFNLFGHDYGGLLSLGIATNTPRRVLRLAILNSKSQGRFSMKWFLMFGLMTVAASVSQVVPVFQLLPNHYFHRQEIVRELQGVVPDARLDRYIGQFEDKAFIEWLQRFYRDFTVTRRSELRLRLQAIACPTTIVWGIHDNFIPFETAIALHEQIAHSELVPLDCGHFPMEQRPQEVLAALEQLLQKPSLP